MPVFADAKVKLFTLNSNPELAQEIADYMGIGYLIVAYKIC